jgi:hypothetical protein
LTIVFGPVGEKKDSGPSGGLNLEVSLPILPLRTQVLLQLEATLCSESESHDELDAPKLCEVFVLFTFFVYFLCYRLLD